MDGLGHHARIDIQDDDNFCSACVHLDVYEDRSVLYEEGRSFEFWEGRQSDEARERYGRIKKAFEQGFLGSVLESVKAQGFEGGLSDDDRDLLNRMVAGITGNCGRGLVAVAVLQMAVKSICPDQSIRLHKSSNMGGSFSWREGISMRKIDSDYVTPFLRESGLLKLNSDGAFMTRTLAENYPYSSVYKAKLQGPRSEWIELVSRLESGEMPARQALGFMLSLLQNRSEEFEKQCEASMEALNRTKNVTIGKTEKALKTFLDATTYPARAFEIVLHAFMQALHDLGYADGSLEPLSQMRSANKKHGNVGDVELKDGRDILEAWDAKYGKGYLRDELNELEDKLDTSPRVSLAGFVTDMQPDLRDDIWDKMENISFEHNTDIKILSFHDWIDYQMRINYVEDDRKLAFAWIRALVESLAQRRFAMAPIDEPCGRWIEDITKTMRRSFK